MVTPSGAGRDRSEDDRLQALLQNRAAEDREAGLHLAIRETSCVVWRQALIRWRRLAPFFLLGPITGPLAAGVVFNFREGRPILATLYAIALVELTALLPVIVAVHGAKLL